MMDIFFQMLQMSLSGSFAVFYLLILRLVLKKLPKKITYVLWGLVGFHLIFTVVPIGRFAVLPKVDIDQELWYVDVNWNVIMAFYLAGVAVILLMNIVNYLHLTRKLSLTAIKREGMGYPFEKEADSHVPVYYSSRIASAFTLGYFPPRIYLPEGIDQDMEEMVVCHEMTHIRRGDYLSKLLAFVLCTLNWFNPLIWCAYYFFVRDQETSCDELVLQKLGIGQKKQYAEAILSAASGFFRSGDMDHAMPFGEANIKYRIRRCVKMVNVEGSRFAVMLLVTLCFFVLGLFVSSVFQIDRLPFIQEQQSCLITAVIDPENHIEYQLRGDGIAKVDEKGENLIYRGSFTSADSFYLTDSGLFFMTGNAKEIRYLNIETNNWEKVFCCGKDKEMASFVPYSGFIKIIYTDGSMELNKLCLRKQSLITAQEILENPGKVYNVTQWKKDGAHACIDLNGDGKDEELFLDFSIDDMLESGDFLYSLSVNKEEVIREEISEISNEIHGVSIDGEHIYIALVTSGGFTSGETRDITSFYRYENDTLLSCGEIPAPISAIKFTDGVITASMSEKILFGETYEESWQAEAGRIIKLGEESDRILLNKKVYDLLKDIELHTEPGSEETIYVSAQRVEMHQFMRNQLWYTDGEETRGYWAELTLEDGTKGWFFISDGRLENGDGAEEVFTLAVFSHPLTATGGEMIEE